MYVYCVYVYCVYVYVSELTAKAIITCVERSSQNQTSIKMYLPLYMKADDMFECEWINDVIEANMQNYLEFNEWREIVRRINRITILPDVKGLSTIDTNLYHL